MSVTPQELILIISPQAQVCTYFERLLQSGGYNAHGCQSWEIAKAALRKTEPLLVLLDEETTISGEGNIPQEISRLRPAAPLVLLSAAPPAKGAARPPEFHALIHPPWQKDEILALAAAAAQRRPAQESSAASLQQRISELEILARLGRSITASLDLDSVLTSIVEAAVELTGAEEGSLLLLDEGSGELYMRAARNFQDEFVRTFRIPVSDTLAGSVIRSGQPVLVDETSPQKIKSSYLIYSLAYVPLQVKGRVFGVLGVDNRQKRSPFGERDLKLLSAIAEFAVIALENARLYSDTIQERKKLQTLLERIEDGVIVLDQQQRLLLINPAAQTAFSLSGQPLIGQPFHQVFARPERRELCEAVAKGVSNRIEIEADDGRAFSAQLTPIPEVGLAITLHDITSLKKLDRIKGEFVSTVSHDLRSPLTAIMGYVELIERVGPVNEMQRDFIHRVQLSVHNITSLVDDLLDLGRIEAGLDTRREQIDLEKILSYAIEGFSKTLTEKAQHIDLELERKLPPLLANPVQIRQMIENLLENALKYTPPGGEITVNTKAEENQVILQVHDSGLGIPPSEMPYIFDKFFRASNASSDIPGTGLGLSIVKSIVDNHNGRIWVDSRLGSGSAFTVVLPIVAAENED